MAFFDQDSEYEAVNLKVQHLREDVALLRRQLNQERKSSIESQQWLIRAGGYNECTRYTSSSTNVLGLSRRVSTTQFNPNNQFSRTTFLPKSNPGPTPEQNSRPIHATYMPSQARPSMHKVWNWNNASLGSKPGHLMAKLKAPGPFERQVLSEIRPNNAKPVGHPRARPTQSNMYTAVRRIRTQRAQFFREQLESIDNSCMQELQRIELSKCRLTPLLEESSTWLSSPHSSEICVSVRTQNACESQCTDSATPTTGRSMVTFNIFEPLANERPSKSSRPSNKPGFNAPNQYCDRQWLAQSSRINTISYNSSSDKFRFEASKSPKQTYNKPELHSPYTYYEEDFSSRTYLGDANESNLFAYQYPSKSKKYAFNGPDNYEQNTSSILGQTVNPEDIFDRKLAVNNSSSRLKPRTRHGSANSTTGSQPSLLSRSNTHKKVSLEECTLAEVQYSPAKYFVNNLSCNWSVSQPKTSSCRFDPTTVDQNQEFSQSSTPTLLGNNSEAHSLIIEMAVKSSQSVSTRLPNEPKYSTKPNFKQGEHNSRRGENSTHSLPHCDPSCSSLTEDEMEEEWFNNKNWTVDEILKLDEEVTKSLWDVYNSHVRVLAADILKPFLSESTMAFVEKEISEQQNDGEAM